MAGGLGVNGSLPRFMCNSEQGGSQSAAELAEGFKRKPLKPVEQVLSALEVLGRARQQGDVWQLE